MSEGVCKAQKRKSLIEVQKIELGFSGKVASVLKHWTVSPVPMWTWSKAGL